MTMEKISKAILDKVKAESDEIIREAEEKARERVEYARQQQSLKYEEEKSRLLKESNNEASRIQGQASISARLELLKVKNEIIDEIVSRTKANLVKQAVNTDLTLNLIREGIKAVGASDVVVHVSSADMDKVKEAVKKDKELSSNIKELKERKCIGGALIEDPENGLRIDNTFDTRLATLLPRVLPEISQELFGS